MTNSAPKTHGESKGSASFRGRLASVAILVVAGFAALECAARVADSLWPFSPRVRWVVTTLLPERILDGDNAALVKPDSLLAVRVAGTGKAADNPYRVGGIVITGAVEDTQWAWIDHEMQRDGFRVAVLGGSAAFGYPYPYDQCFASLLQEHFRSNSVWVSNLARPGLNAGDIANMMQRVCVWVHPDVMVLMTGNNEFIRWQPEWYPAHRGAFWALMARMSDSRLVAAMLYARFKYMTAYSFTDNSARDGAYRQHAELTGYDYATRHVMEQEHPWDEQHWQATRNAYLSRFEKDLRQIIDMAHGKGIKVYACTLPIRYRLSPSWKHPQPLGGDPDIEHFQVMASEYDAALRGADAGRAREVATSMMGEWPASPIPYYLRAHVEDVAGETETAMRDYASCRDRMVGNMGSLPAINEIIRRVSRSSGAELVDIQTIFDDDAKMAGTIDLYMDDDCHPNPRGHRRIAEVLESLLAREI